MYNEEYTAKTQYQLNDNNKQLRMNPTNKLQILKNKII